MSDSNRGRRWVIVAGLTICSAAELSLSGATSLSAALVTVLAYAAGVATTTAATSAYITDVSRREQYVATPGVFGTIYDVADALGPIVAGLLVATVGYSQMFRTMATVAFAMAIVFATVSRPRSR